MNIFLQELSEAFQEYRIILIMDKAAWHRSEDLSKVENIRYIYQPPYSPELNPVEQLWEYIRENYFKNAYWLSMETLEEALAAVLKNCRLFRDDPELRGVPLGYYLVFESEFVSHACWLTSSSGT